MAMTKAQKAKKAKLTKMLLRGAVTVTDRNCRRNRTQEVTKKMREEAVIMGTPIPPHVTRFPVLDNHGRVVQDIIETEHVYTTRAQEVAIKRARRWLRSNGTAWRMGKKPTSHIGLAIQVFQKAEPKQFGALYKELTT